MSHFRDGQSHLQNQLADQAQTAGALLDAYEVTGYGTYLRLGEELMGFTIDRLFDPEHGGFYDTVLDPNAHGFLSKPAKPLDENSVAAHVLTRLAQLTGKDIYKKRAEETLKRFVEIYPQYGFMAADYALAVDAFLQEPTMIRIIGAHANPQTMRLLAEAHMSYEPRRAIQILDPEKDQNTLTDLGYQATESPSAYLCIGTTCTAPITGPNQITTELSKMKRSQIKKQNPASLL
jgi:hypothetical protein